MARTKGKPGPKPTKGKRRDFHILLSDVVQEGQTMSLAEAFDRVAKRHDGVVSFAEEIIQGLPEVQAILSLEGNEE